MTTANDSSHRLVALGLFLLTASTTSSLAQTTTWIGSEDKSWSLQSNWNNGVPTDSNDALIDALPEAIVDVPGEALNVWVSDNGYLSVFEHLAIGQELIVGEEGDLGDVATVNISTNSGRALLTAGIVSIGNGDGEGEVIVGQRGVLEAEFINVKKGGQLILEGGSPKPRVLATNIQMDGGDIVFSQSGNIDFFPLIYGDSGKLLVESGSTRLSLDSSGFSGSTEINGGTLVVDTTLGGNISVSGGTFSGKGNATGTVTVASGGTLAPGNSVGTLQTGDVTFQDGSVFAVEIDSDGNADLLQSSGTVTLQGGTVSVTADSYAEDASFTIITADTAVDGAFADVTSTTFIGYTLAYDSTSVTLNQTVSQSFSDVAMSSNQTAIAGIFDGFETFHEIVQGLHGSMNETEARDAYDQLSGEAHSSLKGALVVNGQRTVGAVNDRIHNDFDDRDANVSTAAYGDTVDAPNGFWITGYGDWLATDKTYNAAAADSDLYGVIAGVDRRIGDYGRLGVLGGYSRTDTSVDALASEADANGYTVGIYGGANNGKAVLSLGALYTWHSIDSSRFVTNPVTELLVADYDARSYQFFAEAGYRMTTGAASFEPFAGVSHINLKTDAFTETGGISALASPSQTSSTTFTTLGLHAALAVSDSARLTGMAGWRHAFGDIDPASSFTVAGSTPFSVLGAPIAEDAAVIEAGIDFQASDTVTIGASYESQYGDVLSGPALATQGDNA